MPGRLNDNKFEFNQFRMKTMKDADQPTRERYKRDNYDKDIESLEKRDEDNSALLWGFVIGFLLFIVIFVLIIIYNNIYR